MLKEIALAVPVALLLWLAVYFLLPPLAGMAEPPVRLVVALKCIAVAVLFCLATGVEAVAHQRLVSPAIDPLAGFETHSLRIDQRYLQNTLEQTVLFVPGLLGLAVYCPDGYAMRAVVAVTAVWIVSRWAFWIGYHRGSLHRALGAPGFMQTLLVLLYVSARFGWDLAGPLGAVIVVAAFAGFEALLARRSLG